MRKKQKEVARRAGMSLARAERFATSVDRRKTGRKATGYLVATALFSVAAIGGLSFYQPDLIDSLYARISGLSNSGAASAPSGDGQIASRERLEQISADVAQIAVDPPSQAGDVELGSDVSIAMGAADDSGPPCTPDVLAALSGVRLTFPPGEYQVNPQEASELTEAARAAAGCPGIEVTVIGHASASEDGPMTRLISWRRADAAIDVLREAEIDVSPYMARGIGIDGDMQSHTQALTATLAVRQLLPASERVQ